MNNPVLVIGAMLALAAGTFAFRFAGPVLRNRVRFAPRVTRLLEISSVVLIAALVAIAALSQGHGFAGFARPVGVLVGGVLAWFKAPFVLVVLAAAGAAALLRLLGVP